jgi:hypothetical protein
MLDPINLFFVSLQSLEAELADNLLHCATVLGIRPVRSAVPYSPDLPMAHLYVPLKIEDLNQRLRFLTDEIGISEEFIIKGLFAHFIEWYEDQSDRDSTADAIDLHLGMIERLRDDLKKPIDQRFYKRPDEEVQAFLEKVQQQASSVPQNRERSEKMRAYFQGLKNNVFNDTFWRQYDREQMTLYKPALDS